MSSKRYFLIPALLAIFCSGALGEERRSLPVSDLETDEDGTPILRVTLHPLHGKGSPRSCRFALDTGTTMTILDTSIPAAFFWDEHTFTEGTDVSGRPFEVPVVLIKRMEVAGMLRDGVPAVRMDLKGGMLGRMQDVPVDGVLGMSSLKETRFVLDQKQRRLEWWGRRSKGGVALPIAYGQAKLPLVMLRIHEREAACVLDTGMADGIGLP